MNKLLDFLRVYRLYRRHHKSHTYCLGIAYGIAFKNLPF